MTLDRVHLDDFANTPAPGVEHRRARLECDQLGELLPRLSQVLRALLETRDLFEDRVPAFGCVRRVGVLHQVLDDLGRIAARCEFGAEEPSGFVVPALRCEFVRVFFRLADESTGAFLLARQLDRGEEFVERLIRLSEFGPSVLELLPHVLRDQKRETHCVCGGCVREVGTARLERSEKQVAPVNAVCVYGGDR